MALSETQTAVYEYCRTREFVEPAVLEEFRKRLDTEGNMQTLSFALEEFERATCQRCGAEGLFKWHFLGQLRHPDCGFSWYARPGVYIARQLGSVFRAGAEFGSEMQERGERTGTTGAGCLYAFFGFIFGFAFRLTVALFLIPVQAVVSLSQAHAPSATRNNGLEDTAPQGQGAPVLCSSCRSTLLIGARFCTQCGSPVSSTVRLADVGETEVNRPRADTAMAIDLQEAGGTSLRCERCKAVLPADSNFCDMCGAKITRVFPTYGGY